MRLRSLVFPTLATSLVLLGACTAKETGYKVKEYHSIKVEDLSDEVKVPTQAWDLLEGKAPSADHHGAPAEEHESGGGGEHGGGHGGGGGAPAAPLAKEFVFSEVTVLLAEKNENVLKKPAYKISLPRGGGEIDLAQYAGISNGTFYVGFEYPEFTEATEKKVLFVSRTKKRKVDEEVYGLGCNQFADISTKFFEIMPEAGIKVNTTRERHVTVLGGHFLFSAQKGNTIYVSQVSFKDSAHPYLFCEAP